MNILRFFHIDTKPRQLSTCLQCHRRTGADPGKVIYLCTVSQENRRGSRSLKKVELEVTPASHPKYQLKSITLSRNILNYFSKKGGSNSRDPPPSFRWIRHCLGFGDLIRIRQCGFVKRAPFLSSPPHQIVPDKHPLHSTVAGIFNTSGVAVPAHEVLDDAPKVRFVQMF